MLWNGSSGSDESGNAINLPKELRQKTIQHHAYMQLAKKENATETYAELKKEYLTIKALLNVSGVNLTDIDLIKE